MDAEVSGARAAGREFDIEFKLLIEAIYQRYHYDFRGYAAASLRRRLRAAMSRFGCGTLVAAAGPGPARANGISRRCWTFSPCR